MSGFAVGVETVEARGYAPESDYPVDAAEIMLIKKLDAIHAATDNVSEEDSWGKQILVVLTESIEAAGSVYNALRRIETDTVSNTIIVIVTTAGPRELVYPLYQ
jgi:hypothetical protein